MVKCRKSAHQTISVLVKPCKHNTYFIPDQDSEETNLFINNFDKCRHSLQSLK